MDPPKSAPQTPSMAPFSLDISPSPSPVQSPSSPKSVPKSPKSPSSRHESPRSLHELPSPLLLATEDITPITSREEESALYSDSDAASQSSTRTKQTKRRATSTNTRRRKSDVSDARSGKSFRSSGNQKDKISPTTKIYRNLLILEESLRQQSRDQRSLKRKFTSFIAILAGLEGFTVYSLYFVVTPPSPVIKITLQLLMLFILITLFLYHLSGEYRRTIVIPRKFFSSTNKGLRQLNLRLVKVNTPISEQFVDFWRSVLRSVVALILMVLSFFSFLQRLEMFKWVTQRLKDIEKRAQPRIGVTDVKLVLNPRAFNSEIREGWELYRDEFWVKEGSKRVKSEEHTVKSTNVLDKDSLVEKHRKERKYRRKSKLGDEVLSSSGELKSPLK